MKITIDIDPTVVKDMMKESLPKKRKRKKKNKIIEQAEKNNKDGEDYLSDSKVWNSGSEPIEWRREEKEFWI